MNQLTERDRPERETGISIECTPDATAEITWRVIDTVSNTQYVVHVDGEQVYRFEDNGHHQATVAARAGAAVEAGVFQVGYPYVSVDTTCGQTPDIATPTTVASTTTTVGMADPVTTTPDVLPHTGGAGFVFPAVMLAFGVTLAGLGRKRKA